MGRDDNNDDHDGEVTMTMMPSMAATIPFGTRSNNQQTTGARSKQMRTARTSTTTTIEDEDKDNNAADQSPLRGGWLAGCDDDRRRRRRWRRARLGQQKMTGWGGGHSTCPYPSRIAWWEAGCSIGG